MIKSDIIMNENIMAFSLMKMTFLIIPVQIFEMIKSDIFINEKIWYFHKY